MLEIKRLFHRYSSILIKLKTDEKYTKIYQVLEDQMYKSKGTILSMFITFILYCGLKNTRANAYFLQHLLIDPLHDQSLAIRSWCYYSLDDLSCAFYTTNYIRLDAFANFVSINVTTIIIGLYFFARQSWNISASVLLTNLSTWLLARYCNSISIYCDVDIFTVYFFVWQFVCLIYQWLYQHLPILSFTLHQKVTCLYMAFVAFIIYDILILIFPIYVLFVLIWLCALIDIVLCLHLTPPSYGPLMDDVDECLSIEYPTVPIGMYLLYDINKVSDEGDDGDIAVAGLGWGDFLIFNILLLLVIPISSSFIIRACVTVGCIVTVQFADLCTSLILYHSSVKSWPGLPLPTMAVSAYAIIIDVIIKYLNLDCEINFHDEL